MLFLLCFYTSTFANKDLCRKVGFALSIDVFLLFERLIKTCCQRFDGFLLFYSSTLNRPIIQS